MYPIWRSMLSDVITEPKTTWQYTRLLFNQVSKLDTKERYLGQQFFQFGPTRPVKVDHLQSWSPIFRSDQLNIHSVPLNQWNIRNDVLKGILIQAWVTCGDGDLQRCWYKVLEVSDLSKLPGIFLLISPSENKTILARATQITFFFFSMDTFISFLSLYIYLPLGSWSLLFHSNEQKEKKKCVNENMVARCFFMSVSA